MKWKEKGIQRDDLSISGLKVACGKADETFEEFCKHDRCVGQQNSNVT